MTLGSAFSGTPSNNPFSPTFGHPPSHLVGRDKLLEHLGSGLQTGPQDPRWKSILLGVRGSGKTVIVNEIANQAAASGWIVLSLDASTPGLLTRIAKAVYTAPRDYDSLSFPDLGMADARHVATRVGGLHRWLQFVGCCQPCSM